MSKPDIRRTRPAEPVIQRLPDIINCSHTGTFTQVPNAMLRNPELSLRAKGLLCILLSNSVGWSSHIATLRRMTSDSPTVIRGALTELERAGYLLRVELKNAKTKAFAGVIWAYSDTPYSYDMDELFAMISERNLETTQKFAADGFSVYGFSVFGKSNAKNTKSKNTKKRIDDDDARSASAPTRTGTHTGAHDNTDGVAQPALMADQALITPAMFEQWWKLYPRKVDKGKAKTKWGQLCRRAQRPTFALLRDAVQAQAATERWAQPQYIPHPTTWLNQERWLDDPAAMGALTPAGNGDQQSSRVLPPDQYAEHVLGSSFLAAQFMADCTKPALAWLGKGADAEHVTTRLLAMYSAVAAAQEGLTAALRAVIPGPMDVVEQYIGWLDDNTWITDRAPRVFDVGGALFGRYRTWAASRDPLMRDPLTGEAVRAYG